jgi:N-acetylmuramoyl-L-alanine amidase
LKRRTLLQHGSVVLVLGLPHLVHSAEGATIVTVRVWPAPEYSRVTIESDAALTAKQNFVPNPPRLAVDIEGITLNPALIELVAKVKADDPNIAGIRVGQYAPNVVRLVVDLKVPIRPQVFALAPVAAYQHRLVFDLYPEQEVDPLEALIAQRLQASVPKSVAPLTPVSSAAPDPLGELIARQDATKSIAGNVQSTGAEGQKDLKITAPTPATPTTTERLIIVALDPGHGGEDPGAIGPGGTKKSASRVR